MKRVISTAFALAALIGGGAAAAPIGFTFDAGPVLFVERSPLLPPGISDVRTFIEGEHVLVTFTIESTTSDDDVEVGSGEFEDPNGTITLTGKQSGTTIAMRNGVNIQLDTVFEFDLRNIQNFPPFPGEFNLFDDIDYEAATPILRNPDDLAGSIAELAALLDGDGRFIPPNTALGSTGIVDAFALGIGPFPFPDVLEFGPVTNVPLPASALLLLSGLGALAVARRR